MPEHFEEEIREFLIESNENLANLDREIVELEQRPNDPELISSVFRTIHTIKGTCGFFGFDHLGSVAHITENILSQVRERQRRLTPELISLVLEAVDKIKALLLKIESSGNEGLDDSSELRARLEAAYRMSSDKSCQQNIVETVADAVPEAAETSYEERPTREAQSAESTIRVDVVLLDKLMNLVGELVLARNQLLQDATMQSPMLQQTSQRLNLITSELQEGVMKTRMQPIGVVWNKLPRVVRDLAAKCGKRIRIEMEGAGTELDKTIIEAIKDPLTHIVRNSCDHGIETPEIRAAKQKSAEGLLLLRAYHEGGVVNIEICDDGAGIDAEKLKKKATEKGLLRPEQAAAMSDRDARRLIFLPGLSTAQQVTSISGRGVGMDVVKTNIEKIGGSVEAIDREPHGTIIRIKIPLTLAIIPGLIVSLDATAGTAKEQRFVVPQANLLELVRLQDEDDLELIEDLHGTPVFHHRGRLLPLVYLSRVLNHDANRTLTGSMEQGVNIVVLQAEGCQMGLVVDQIRDTQEIVVKPLGRQLKGLSCYVGATIMGDGRPALILDVTGLARLAGLAGQSGAAVQMALAESSFAQAQTSSQSDPQMMLLFRAGRFERLAVPLALVARLEEINAKTIERAAGSTVLNYRGEILPLIRLGSMLERSGSDLPIEGMVQVIVFADGDRRVGVMVDRIEDIVNEAIVIKRTSVVRGLLGSAILGGKITDLLDLDAVVEAAAESQLPATISHASAMLASYQGFSTEAVQ